MPFIALGHFSVDDHAVAYLKTNSLMKWHLQIHIFNIIYLLRSYFTSVPEVHTRDMDRRKDEDLGLKKLVGSLH